MTEDNEFIIELVFETSPDSILLEDSDQPRELTSRRVIPTRASRHFIKDALMKSLEACNHAERHVPQGFLGTLLLQQNHSQPGIPQA